ncbi:MAG: 1-acyl-sn-glycerol-3-phosphate acyltransferase [Bdellovibrio sp.]|nr:1-acyl-sn-glycerol-3-phosphate acyltransferase [Methylotenera sp.]
MTHTNLTIRTFRTVRIFVHTIIGLIVASAVLPLVNVQHQRSLIQWWCGGLLRAFHIQVKTFGNLPSAKTQGVMFVANHVSWADIHALNGLIPLRFVAKSDIKSWPVFGYLVTKANTLFIDRSKRQAAGRIVETVSNSLIAGDNLCYFPEGTTTDGTHMLPFKSSVLQAAINAKTHIWPVAIRYINADGSINTEMAYAGETTMIESMKLIVMQKNAIVELHFLAPIQAFSGDRRALTDVAFAAIKAKLAL